MTTENAPGAAGTAAEGENQKPFKESVESKATRHARARAARPGTIAADHRVIIMDVPADASVHLRDGNESRTRRSSKLTDQVAALPLLVRHTTRGVRACVWRTSDGLWWRKGGIVQIKQHELPGGVERAFVVTVFKGANADDVRFLLDVVADARRGLHLDLWDKVHADWADNLTWGFSASRSYQDPYVCPDVSPKVSICAEPLCREQWHSDPLHEADSAEGPGYSISVARYGDESLWHVDVNADGSEFTPDQLAVFVNDLQWMRAECERANRGGDS